MSTLHLMDLLESLKKAFAKSGKLWILKNL